MTEQSKPREYTREELVRDLKATGVVAGMKLMVHSSQKAVGRTVGGVETIVHALMDVITPDGILMFPSFNHGKPWEAKGKGFYNPKTTPTWNGAVPDAFWRMPGVLRSLDPTHAIACWGNDAQRFIQNHHRTLTMGPDSPLGMLAREGGYALMIGVGYNPNTFHHIVEMTLASPCLGQRTEEYEIHLPDGRAVKGRTWGWRAGQCPITDPVRYAPFLKPFQKDGRFGAAEAILFKFQDAFPVIAGFLKEGMGKYPPCHKCPVRPRKVAQTVESDWDVAKNCPKPDSTCWSY